MTIVRHIFSPALPHRSEAHRWWTRTKRGTRGSEARADGAARSGITSTPWEGLYLEIDETVDNTAADGLLTALGLVLPGERV